MRQSRNAPMREPVPAATVALVRPAASAAGIEVLLLRRNAKLVFHGGHWVFPGGRIDAADFGGQAQTERLYSAALKAALRETREETGIEIDANRLIYMGHWTTPPGLPRRFSTWFFVCPATRRSAVKIDEDEITDYRWLSPRQALQDAREEKLVLPRPTRVTLSDIGVYETLADLEQGLKNRPIRVFPPNSNHYRPTEMGCPARAG